ncbi:MAG: hypothetical protein QOF56_850, partial [Acidobacteriaceae bacterium]|nr:hypothetical protein [Acidobacteriaceae bacterium]
AITIGADHAKCLVIVEYVGQDFAQHTIFDKKKERAMWRGGLVAGAFHRLR